jgi:hypothetical protein
LAANGCKLVVADDAPFPLKTEIAVERLKMSFELIDHASAHVRITRTGGVPKMRRGPDLVLRKIGGRRLAAAQNQSAKEQAEDVSLLLNVALCHCSVPRCPEDRRVHSPTD